MGTTSPKIDGIFNNDEWRDGGMATGYIQMNPDEGEQATGYQGNEIGFYNYNDFREAFVWIQVAPRIEKIGIRRFIHNINIWTENYWANNYFDDGSLTR